ncbi:MAG: TetR/AcrR family transcriptional regulator [Chloroflexota bacterium]
MVRQAARREATRDQLISAAAALFAARGYEATTVDDIVREADLAKGTFYYHFKSKEELVVIMARLALGEAVSLMQARIAEGWPPITALRSFFQEAAAAAERDRDLSRVFIKQSLTAPPPAWQGTPLPSFRAAATLGVTAAQEAGNLRSDRGAAELGGYLGALFLAAEVAWLTLDADDSLVTRADHAFTFFLEGAGAR